MRKILVINFFGIGDVLFTVPLLRNIREQVPDAFIGYVCNRRVLPILEHNPLINKIYIYERDEYFELQKKSPWQAWQKALREISEIRAQHFDTVIDLSLNSSFSFLSWFLGIPQRVGFNHKNRSPFLTRKININGYAGQHLVEHNLGLLPQIGLEARFRKMEIFLQPQDVQWARETLRQHQLAANDCLVAVVPGGGASWGRDARFKRWPAEQYGRLIDIIVEKFSAKIILLGDFKEQELAQGVMKSAHTPIIDLTGKTTLGQYAAMLSLCRLAVVNDGGPLHLAVAAGARTVSIFGPVDEKVYGPYPMAGHAVVTKGIACRPCYRHFRRAQCDHASCLQQLTVEEVFGKVAEMLNEKLK